MAIQVAVLGGGIGGLTAAHELIERGFAVSVFEAKDQLGGKAPLIEYDRVRFRLGLSRAGCVVERPASNRVS